MNQPQKNEAPAFKHLFGPVHSRRLGISLGVDMVAFKTCSLDCIYCECGATTFHSLDRREYVAADELIEELDTYLSTTPALDYVTFAGSGEPTLNSAIGPVLRHVHERFPRYRTALLTNGSLLYDPAVREDLALFDLVLPSLDAVLQTTFEKINRPAPGLTADMIIEGLRLFAQAYTGQLWVELFLAAGINDSDEELQRFRDVLLTTQPARVQLNTLDRPGTCDWVEPLPRQRLEEIARILSPLPVEIISRAEAPPISETRRQQVHDTILSSLARRPSTVEDLTVATGLTVDRLTPILNDLQQSGQIVTRLVSDRTFYICNP